MQDDLKGLIKLAHDFFISFNYTLSIAESCTGGLICSLLTDLPGASQFFKGGIITYWTETKIDILGVSSETIKVKGVISSETAIEMAQRVRKLFYSDYGLSITGNLGPTVMEGKALGLVYIGISKEGQTKAIQGLFTDDRLKNKMAAAKLALESLLKF
ncbi:MAG: CinA family protein [Thermodesulfovibrionales bacterium]|nr:CinA family protein [Thermodesulfovibrionales bacterium]